MFWVLAVDDWDEDTEQTHAAGCTQQHLDALSDLAFWDASQNFFTF